MRKKDRLTVALWEAATKDVHEKSPRKSLSTGKGKQEQEPTSENRDTVLDRKSQVTLLDKGRSEISFALLNF